ncbi:hypothetical protein TSUD_34080 [Trifolium subterraneum]|uniref:Prefoldin subunit 4 n=1 Tax=Trifolium subterraneum TaxID=3900 RepID=A0A2Z6LRY0_TRISU|nr:hypothetical protein TSUD_34080 [Trifolium subterraneum]
MQQGGGSETEVTWEDQQNINKFGRLNNRLHELHDEIKIAKSFPEKHRLPPLKPPIPTASPLQTTPPYPPPVRHIPAAQREANDNLEDASNELILTDEEVVRFQIGEVFAHVPKDEVESRIEQMQEATSQKLEKLEEEKKSVVAQMSELKKILYGKFGESINLEED